MSHGENFREISHEKETHKQFHKVFHALVLPLCPLPFLFSFPEAWWKKTGLKILFIYSAIRGRTKQRIGHSVLWHSEDLSAASFYSWNKEMHCIKNWQLQAFKNYESDCQNPNTLNNHSLSSLQTCCQEMNGFFLLLRQMGRWKIPKHVLPMAMFSISWKANVSKSQ